MVDFNKLRLGLADRQPSNRRLLAKWLAYFQRRFGHDLPTDYLAFDLETTGFGDIDLIWEIGHCIVRDGKPTHRGKLILDWTRHPKVDQDWLHHAIDKIRSRMASQFKTCNLTYELLRDQGIKPERALTHYYELLSTIRKHRGFFLGANIYNFDNRMFGNQLYEFVGHDWDFQPDEAFDVGALEKARQLDLMPFHDESLRQYFGRVNGIRKEGARWNIEHCIRTYSLAEKYEIDESQCHGCDYDAYVTHLIFEEQRLLGQHPE